MTYSTFYCHFDQLLNGIYVCMYLYISVCVCVCVRERERENVCMYLGRYVCAYVCVYVCIAKIIQ